MIPALEGYDWSEVFAAAGIDKGENPIDLTRAVPADYTVPLDLFSREDVAEVLHIEEGENDEQNWIVVVRLKDGRFAFLEGGCDYTGWDCRSSCSAEVASTYEEIIRFGCGESARRRFGLEIDGEQVRYEAKQ